MSTQSEQTARSSSATLSHEVVRLVRASHAMRQQVLARTHEGLEGAAFALLMMLCKEGPQRTSALAAMACVDPSTVSRQVAQLVELGLVERLADPRDGRATLLAATALGEAKHRVTHERRERAFDAMLADWPEDDVRRLAELLSRLNDTFLDQRASMLDAMAPHDHTHQTSTQENA